MSIGMGHPTLCYELSEVHMSNKATRSGLANPLRVALNPDFIGAVIFSLYLSCTQIDTCSISGSLHYYISHILSLLLEVGKQQLVGSHDINSKGIQSEQKFIRIHIFCCEAIY